MDKATIEQLAGLIILLILVLKRDYLKNIPMKMSKGLFIFTIVCAVGVGIAVFGWGTMK